MTKNFSVGTLTDFHPTVYYICTVEWKKFTSNVLNICRLQVTFFTIMIINLFKHDVPSFELLNF